MHGTSQTGLIRALSLTALIIYGLGDILGAGIYAIIGKIAGHAGGLTWLSFVIAVLAALPTALTYGELGCRFPKSGGVSVYIQKAFDVPYLSLFAGLLLFSATILSMAALSHAFVGYLTSVGFKAPNWLGVFCLLTVLLLINLRGIKQSSLANIISTFVEVSGLFIVLICGVWYLTSQSARMSEPSMVTEPTIGITGVLQGAALAFYAFTGFEDLANVAEEVQHPEKNIPRAILSAIALATLMYLGVSAVATAVVPGSELSQSSAPLLAVVSKAYPAFPQFLFSIIAMFAIFNTTLLNYITTSRLLYGMSKIDLLPSFLKRVHSKFHTPYMAILLIFPLVLGAGLTGTLIELASSASVVVLLVFSLSSSALIKIKRNESKQKTDPDRKIFTIPLVIPYLAILCNLTLIAYMPLRNIIHAILFITLASIMTWILKTSRELA